MTATKCKTDVDGPEVRGKENGDRKTGDDEKNDTLLNVIFEPEDKPFIYDVYENPPILMTLFFAMQVRIFIVLSRHHVRNVPKQKHRKYCCELTRKILKQTKKRKQNV